MIPPEILCHIFSSLSYSDLYRIRAVCHEWKLQSEYTLYLIFKRKQQKLSVQIGGKHASVIDLVPVHYDPAHQVIEFHTPQNENDQPDEYDLYINNTTDNLHAKVTFSEWRERTQVSAKMIQNLDLEENALALFHLTYNPCLEQFYEFPSLDSVTDTQTRYIGDRGIIIAFEYHNETPMLIDFQGLNEEPPSPFDNNEHRITKRIKIKSIHANLSWLLSGIDPRVIVQQIYQPKYQKLMDTLNAKGIKPSTPYSNDILSCVINGNDPSLFQEKEESIHSKRLYQVQSKLQENGVDPRVVWKYTLAKNFIYRPRFSTMDLDAVVRALLESERKWVLQKIDLIRKIIKIE